MMAEMGRGIQLLANEPSYAVIHLILFIPLLAMLRQNNYRLLILLSVVFVFFTRSANGVLLLVGLLLMYLLIYRKFTALFVAFLITLVLFSISSFILDSLDGRSATIIKMLVSRPDLLLADSSISSRLSIITANYLSWYSSPIWGNGLGSFAVTQSDIFQLYDITSYEIEQTLAGGGTVAYMSFMGGLLSDLGLIGGVVYVVTFLLPSIRSSNKTSLLCIAIIVFIQLQTISFSLPIQWFILGLIASPQFHSGWWQGSSSEGRQAV